MIRLAFYFLLFAAGGWRGGGVGDVCVCVEGEKTAGAGLVADLLTFCVLFRGRGGGDAVRRRSLPFLLSLALSSPERGPRGGPGRFVFV